MLFIWVSLLFVMLVFYLFSRRRQAHTIEAVSVTSIGLKERQQMGGGDLIIQAVALQDPGSDVEYTIEEANDM